MYTISGNHARAGRGGRFAPGGAAAFALFALLFACAARGAAAQQISRFAVYAAKGDKFSISYDGQTRVYRPEPIPSGGITVQKKDLIKTGDDSVVELRSYPPGITILVADKSQVALENIADGAYHVVALVFGRVRVINTTADQTVIVRAGRSLVEAGPGDMNVDYALYPWADGQASRTLVVSAIKNGALLSIPASANGNGKKNGGEGGSTQISLKEGETLYVDPIMSITEKRPLYQGLQPYWSRKGYWGMKPAADRYAAGFSPTLSEAPPPASPPKPRPAAAAKPARTAEPPPPAPAPAERAERPPEGAPAARLETLPYSEPGPILPREAAPKKKSKAGARALGIGIGAALIGGGAFMQYGLPSVAPSVAGDRQLKSTMYVGGFIPMGLGLITVIGSLLQ